MKYAAWMLTLTAVAVSGPWSVAQDSGPRLGGTSRRLLSSVSQNDPPAVKSQTEAPATATPPPAPATDPAVPQANPEEPPKDDGKREYTESTVVECPKLDNLKQLRKVAQMDVQTLPTSGKLPPDCARRVLDELHGNSSNSADCRGFVGNVVQWTPPGLARYPAYFEDVPLERYGQTRHRFVQPFVSAGRFFAQVPALPYKMALEPPCEPICSLGYYRPGNCTPPMRQGLYWDSEAGVVEALFIAGAILLIP